MRVIIKRSEVEGRATVPPSKSYTHRALICSALADGISTILSPLISDDSEATTEILMKLGVGVTRDSESWTVRGGSLQPFSGGLYCRESGTTLRLMTAFCTLVNGESRLTAGQTLSNRPVGPLIDGLNQLGANCNSNNGFPPVSIMGKNSLKGGIAKIPGNISSQFVSAILLVAPSTDEGVTIRLTTPLESKPYVLMTIDSQQHFNVEPIASPNMMEFSVRKQEYKPTTYKVEGDWSSATYLLAAAALTGKVEVVGLNNRSSQADMKIINTLRMMGVKISSKQGSITVEKARLKSIEVNVSDQPDLFPAISILCARAEGRSIIHGTRRLKFKESDRLAATEEGLRSMGVKTQKRGDSFLIEGNSTQGGIINPRRDHRIAMAFGVLGLASEGETTILDAECVSKSYPEFWHTMETLGSQIRRQ